jgi:hypothetical protein
MAATDPRIIRAIQGIEAEIAVHRAVLRVMLAKVFHGDLKAFDAFATGLQVSGAFSEVENPEGTTFSTSDNRIFLERTSATLYNFLAEVRSELSPNV